MIRIRRRISQPSWKPQFELDYVNLLESIFSSSNAAIAYLDLEANFVRVNQSFAAISKHDPDFFTGKNIFDIFSLDSKRSVFKEVARTGQPYYELNSTYEDPFRGTAHFSWSLQMMRRVDGAGVGLLLIVADITERIRVETELKESRALFEHLFESDPDANILVDESGKIISINQQTEADFGYRREELIGKSIEVLLPARFRGIHVTDRKRYVNSPQMQLMGFHKEIKGRRKTGEEFPLEVIINPLKTDKGLLILAVARDITQRVQMQHEIAEIQHSLIESAEVERLHLAQDLHDGPIQELYGVTYMLQSLETAAEGLHLQGDLAGARIALNQVINVLRDICSNLRPTALLPFGLNRAITSHADHFRGAYPTLQVHLDLAEDGTVLSETVRLALYRIYQHLVSNVVRHAHARNIWIRFIMEADQVALEVEDDGVGFRVPDRYIELVRQGHFGLAGATERAEAIGGTVEITTAPGKGTHIRVNVPIPNAMRQAEQVSLSSGQ